MLRAGPARRFLAPEVVQTSAMDCGPASLKCLLEGFGIPVAYGRLREACQTDVDGTSIDTMEEIAGQLGLEAEQLLLPPEHLLLDEARALPAIVVVRQPNGTTHFVVVWGRLGGRVQIMDPATGRRWLTRAELLDQLYLHRLAVPAEAFRAWAASDDFARAIGRRLAALGAPGSGRAPREAALADPGWRSIAALDAATRLVESIVRSGGLPRGRAAVRLLDALLDQARSDSGAIPEKLWSVRAAPPDDSGAEQVFLRGAVVVRILGRRRAPEPARSDAAPTSTPAQPLSPELAAALAEPPSRPWRDLYRLLRGEGILTPSVLLGALALSAFGTALEAVLLRGLLQVGGELGLVEQRLAATAALVLVLAALLAIELPLTASLLRVGRHLEAGLRVAFLSKIPRLGDRYFQSRPTSDMAQRSHTAHALREVPKAGAELVRSAFDLAVTTAAIAWVDPASARLAIAAAVLLFALPIAAGRVLVERDLRLRTHVGALTRFYLDALLGLVPIRAHVAERAIRREHEGLLVEWARAGRSLLRAAVATEALQAIAGLGLAGWLLVDYLGRAGSPAGALLLLYWSLALPAIGQEIAVNVRQYPAYRNVALRLFEPLGAPEEARDEAHTGEDASAAAATAPITPGIAVAFESVTVHAGGHTLLDAVDLAIPAGSHVAVVGSSGAGKSSLVGLLLGWHRAAAGRVLVGGAPLDAARLDQLRAETAWVDPAVQLYNRTLLENLRYGASDAAVDMSRVLRGAGLREILERLPEGLQTVLGEGGALVSGGEGQRVRFGRALLRADARLVILDEPFRGLDRARRRELLAHAREIWRDATLLCVTHDVGETRGFERVIVIDRGRVVEDGTPAELAARPGSRYRALLDAEDAVRQGLWSSAAWRRLRLERGRVAEAPEREGP